MDIRNETLTAYVSTAVSAIDGIPYDVAPAFVYTSAFLGTMAEAMFKLMNRLTVPSATLISGGSAGSVALGVPSTIGNSAIRGTVHGMNFVITNVGLSGQPVSGVSTASYQIRKVGVALKLSALPGGSSLDATAGSIQFVIGSAWRTVASSVLSGGVSASFNLVPDPKFSADQVPVGMLMIPNSFAASAGIAAHMIDTDARRWGGFDFSAIFQGLMQP